MLDIHNTTKDKILKFLLSNRKEEFTIRGISKEVSVDYKTVYIVTKELISRNLVHSKKAGQTVLCSMNQKEFNDDIFRVEIIRKIDILKNKDLSILYNYFKDIKEPFFILLLFGSYASKKNRKDSDIDLMLISDDEKINKKFKEVVSLIPLRIHPINFNSKEFISMLKTTDFNVGKEVFYNNIILFGIEDYYRLTQNA